jgi:hypothetical protein
MNSDLRDSVISSLLACDTLQNAKPKVDPFRFARQWLRQIQSDMHALLHDPELEDARKDCNRVHFIGFS